MGPTAPPAVYDLMAYETAYIREYVATRPTLPVEHRSSAPLAPEYIETLLATYFQPDDLAWARRVGACESRWNPNAKNDHSTAAGLFQFLRGTWDWVAPKLGFDDYASGAVYDPEMNVRAAAWLYYNVGPSQWECK